MKHFIFCLLLLLPCSILADTNCNILRVDQVNNAPIPRHGFAVDGYVTHISDCPVCPKGAVCEACAAPHFIVSERNAEPNLKSATLVFDELILFPSPETWQKNLVKGKHYRFVLVPDSDPTWTFNGTYANSFNRRLTAKSFIVDPIPCHEQ